MKSKETLKQDLRTEIKQLRRKDPVIKMFLTCYNVERITGIKSANYSDAILSGKKNMSDEMYYVLRTYVNQIKKSMDKVKSKYNIKYIKLRIRYIAGDL